MAHGVVILSSGNDISIVLPFQINQLVRPLLVTVGGVYDAPHQTITNVFFAADSAMRELQCRLCVRAIAKILSQPGHDIEWQWIIHRLRSPVSYRNDLDAR